MFFPTDKKPWIPPRPAFQLYYCLDSFLKKGYKRVKIKRKDHGINTPIIIAANTSLG